MTVRRPILRWHGGKWKLAPWIIAQFPAHRVYVEPYGGAASVLLRKPRSYAEIYNDLDDEVVGLFRILRSSDSDRLVNALRLTPFSRAEFNDAYHDTDDEIERARRLIIRSFMGFGSDGTNTEWRTGFRANSKRRGTTPAHDWNNLADGLQFTVDRLRGVVIENRDAREVMAAHDSPDTLHYVDPPYVLATRSEKSRRKADGFGGRAYKHELTDADHVALIDFLQSLRGAVILSGYDNRIYDSLSWHRIEKKAHADGARERTECLWLSDRAVTMPSLQLQAAE